MSKCNRMRSRRSLSTSVIRITNISDGKSSILRVFSIIHSVGKTKNVRKENEFAVFRCLEDRNTIEMQAITALAHLRAAILYVMDLSETCGYTLEEQVERFDRFIRNHIVVLLVQLNLFNNIKVLFTNKPLLIVLNKIDIKRLDELSEEKKAVFEQFRKDDVRIIEMSTFSEEGVIEVRNEVKKSPFRFFSS